jgi:hypothetical protein
MKMISTKSKLALVLSVVGAIALSVPSAEARTKRNAAKAQTNAQDQVVSGRRAEQPLFGRSYNFDPAFTSGGGINFRDARGGANYNPNQGP